MSGWNGPVWCTGFPAPGFTQPTEPKNSTSKLAILVIRSKEDHYSTVLKLYSLRAERSLWDHPIPASFIEKIEMRKLRPMRQPEVMEIQITDPRPEPALSQLPQKHPWGFKG